MATMIAGAATSNILAARRVVDMADTIYLLEPNAAPLYVLVSKLKKKSVHNVRFDWLEDDLNPRTTATASTHNTGNLTIEIANKGYVNAFDIMYNTDKDEMMLATATTTGSSITVQRGFAGTDAASCNTGDTILIMGSAFEEGMAESNVLTKSTKVSNEFNLTQIFRKKVEVTGSLAAMELYGGADRQYQRKKKGIELMRDFETAFWWGSRASSTRTSGTYKTRTMNGVNSMVTTNSTTSIGTMTETEFEGILRDPFRYGNNQKYMFASPLAISVISQWAQGKLNMVPKDRTYGIAITQYLSPHGTLNLVKENLFESASDHGGHSFILELGELQYVFLRGRDVKLQTNIGTIGDDKFMDQYICEISLELHSQKKHAKLAGVTG